MSIKEKVRIAVAEKTGGRFSAVDLAHDIGVPTKYGNASYEVCPSVTKELLKLCKDGVLYQWVIGTGGRLDGITFNGYCWEMYYLRRDSDLAKTLIEHPNRIVNGHRIR